MLGPDHISIRALMLISTKKNILSLYSKSMAYWHFENLYTYHTFMETLKILKLRTPLSLHDMYIRSTRKDTTLITPFPSDDFISRSTKIWNTLTPKLKLLDFSFKISLAKSKLKKALLKNQIGGDMITWTDNNFDIKKLIV